MISTFYIRKQTKSSISGEAAWIAKTKLQSPVYESVSFQDVVENVISMKDGNALFQINRPDKTEILTVANELVGNIELYLSNKLSRYILFF